MTLQWSILAASALLLVGLALYAMVPWFRRFYIPASVIGGTVGLGVVQVVNRIEASTDVATMIGSGLRAWPGWLIAVVFAGLLLERPKSTADRIARPAHVWRAGLMVWIIVLGEIVIGLVATWLWIARVYDVPAAFGQLIEAGFAGGHGTASALGEVFADPLSFPAGRDLGFFMATFGLVYSIVSGIVFVNIGVRRGWTCQRATSGDTRDAPKVCGAAPSRSRFPVDVIEPLAVQAALLAAAFLSGIVIQMLLTQVATWVAWEDVAAMLGRLPLFLFTLLGGWLVRRGLTTLGLDDLIDTVMVKRLVGLAMEYLIVAAIASLRIDVIATYAAPLAVLCGLGAIWAGFCLVVLSRRILPTAYWFELGLLNYGMSTGTTAQGIMLLRIVDPDLSSGAAETYALAAPLSAPFVGGGILTISLPVIMLTSGLPLMIAVTGIATVVLIGLGLMWRSARTSQDV